MVIALAVLFPYAAIRSDFTLGRQLTPTPLLLLYILTIQHGYMQHHYTRSDSSAAGQDYGYDVCTGVLLTEKLILTSAEYLPSPAHGR